MITAGKRRVIVAATALCCSLGPVAGNIYLPVTDLLSETFHASKEAIHGTISVFMVVFAFAPLILSLVLDSYGRRPVLLVSVVIFIVANILIATVPPNLAALYVLRAVQAFGASTLAIGVGVVTDVTRPQARGRNVALFMIGPQLGPVIGPMLGLVGTQIDWRWNFAILAILGGLAMLVIYVLLPETLPALIGTSGPETSYRKVMLTFAIAKPQNPQAPTKPRVNFLLYLLLCINRPVLCTALAGGIAFATFYAVLVLLATMLADRYEFRLLQVCFAYVCPGISLAVGLLVFGELSDQFRKHAGEYGSPEVRLKVQLSALVLMILSIFSYAWSVQAHIHVVFVIMIFSSVAFFVAGVLTINTTYLSEISRHQPASFVAFANMIRNLGAAAFITAVQPLVNKLDYGVAFSIVGSIAVVSLPFTLLVAYCGERWREGSRHSSDETHSHEGKG